jgi:hypothetical protein
MREKKDRFCTMTGCVLLFFPKSTCIQSQSRPLCDSLPRHGCGNFGHSVSRRRAIATHARIRFSTSIRGRLQPRLFELVGLRVRRVPSGNKRFRSAGKVVATDQLNAERGSYGKGQFSRASPQLSVVCNQFRNGESLTASDPYSMSHAQARQLCSISSNRSRC